jgi:hypothetical protein
MSILLAVLGMFVITFIVSMFVALIIKMIYASITSVTVTKYSDPQLMQEVHRAVRINKIRRKRIRIAAYEQSKKSNFEIFNFYLDRIKEQRYNGNTNAIVEHFYESK